CSKPIRPRYKRKWVGFRRMGRKVRPSSAAAGASLSLLPDATVRLASGFVAQPTVLRRHDMNRAAARAIQFQRQATYPLEGVRLRVKSACNDPPRGGAGELPRIH